MTDPDRPDPVTQVLNQWAQEAAVLARTGHDREAEVLRRRIRQVRDARGRGPCDWLSTEEAVAWSGYTRDHLQGLARDGRVHAERRADGWYFARGALPRKPRPHAHPEPEAGLRASQRAARRALGGG